MDTLVDSTLKTAPADPLVQLLAQNEEVKLQLDRSAVALSEVAVALKEALASDDPLRGCATALAGSLAAVDRLRHLAHALAASNQVLAYQVRESIITNHRFAAAVEQERVARVAALHDRMTGLPNRALFDDRLAHAIARAARHKEMLAVMFVDLDKFKHINDTYGHTAGDAVLKVTAARLNEKMRAEDTVSRHGGDEFLYLCTEVRERGDCATIAAKILQAIRTPCTVIVDAQPLLLSLDASLGIALFPQDGATADALVRSADAAMYQAKQCHTGYAFAR